MKGAVGMKRAMGILVAGLLTITFACIESRTDPETGRIRLLFVGQWPMACRPQYLIEDPLLRTSIVPYHDFGVQLEQIRRYMHQRYPRTPKHLTDNYDVVAFSNIQLPTFTARQIDMVAEAVREKALGYIMMGGHTSFGGTTDRYPSWAGTSIDGILPVEVVEGIYIRPIFFKLVVSDPSNALMISLPWSDLPPFSYTLNAVTMRQGGHLLAETNLKERHPVLAFGDFEMGRTLVFMTPLNVCDNYNMRDWGFFDDMCANFVYFGARVELPSDPFMIHQLRGRLRGYHDERLLFLSMIEFVDKLGANVARLEDQLSEIELIRVESYSAYVSQEYESSAELMEQALDRMKAGSADAIKIKNATMLWIYVIEWIAVTATLMITGSLLWSLMVRRRLYREMGITRSLVPTRD